MTVLQRGGAALPALALGCVQALVCIVAKPLAGLLDSLSYSCFSVQDAWLGMLGADASSALRQRSQRVRPPRHFGPDKALKDLVFKQSHASQLLSKVDRGRLTLGGALDLLDLSGGAQLLVTPLLLICIDPHEPRRSLWTVSMRHVLSAHIPSQDERVELSHLILVSGFPPNDASRISASRIRCGTT